MTRWLHLVRGGPDEWVMGLVRHQAGAGPVPMVVLLRQVGCRPPVFPAAVPLLRFRSTRDGVAAAGEVDESGLIRLMEEHDRVAVW
jgi:hypothetical protein